MGGAEQSYWDGTILHEDCDVGVISSFQTGIGNGRFHLFISGVLGLAFFFFSLFGICDGID